MRFRGGEARQSRAPGARHSPLPPCRRAWWGGTRAPADAGCSVGSAPLCVRCSPARALPTGSRLPTSTPRRRAGPGALTGLRSAARALPAGSMALPDLRVRPQRRPENGRQRLGPDAPVRPWCSAGRTVARPRAPTRRASGALQATSLPHPTPGATAAEPGSQRAAQPPSRPWALGTGLAHRSPMQF